MGITLNIHEKQLNLFGTLNEVKGNLNIDYKPCPYCGRTNFMIREKDYYGNIYYTLTHDDFSLGWKKRICGIMLSDTNKKELIEWYNSMEWVKQHDKYAQP